MSTMQQQPQDYSADAPVGSRLRATGGVGGGYGNPRERNEQAVLDDVLDGLLGRDEAAREFGVAITEALTLDEEGTRKLRAS